jgi:uncharacterized protein YcbK (DUF882 family)
MSGFSTRTMRPEDWVTIKHFSPAEFKHPDVMGLEFMKWLDTLRSQAGVPMHVSSSYRSKAYNASVGGATDSAHVDVPCNAVDVAERPRPDDLNWNYSRFRIVSAAILMGCKRIGTYQNGSLHLDMTHDRRPSPRMWRVVGSISP